EPIIDKATWHIVQNKIKTPEKTKSIINDNIPLRGILKCHCGNPLTGAASRGKLGKYYYYYKCNNTSKHNNISAIKAHQQFLGICKLMSISERDIQLIRKKSN